MKISGGHVLPGAGRNTGKMANVGKFLLLFGKKFPRHRQAAINSVLSDIFVVIFTTALSLSGSYLFFTQLAEYGW